jgi:hypothetical protein
MDGLAFSIDHTARDRLAAAIDTISRLGPAAVFADVDLSLSVPKESDGAFRNLLREYGAAGAARSPLVLVRGVISGRTAPTYLLEERPTDYDSLVYSAPNIVWASTLFEEGSDALVRGWRLVEPVCVHGAPKVLPSAELALAAIAAGKAASLNETLRTLTPPNCGTREPSERTAPTLDLGQNLVVKLAEEETGRRVLYSLEWRRPGEFEPSRPRFLGPNVDFEGRLVPLVTVLPIGNVLFTGVDQDGAGSWIGSRAKRADKGMSRNSRTRADPVPKSDIVRARDALVARILEGEGTAPLAQRRAAFWRAKGLLLLAITALYVPDTQNRPGSTTSSTPRSPRPIRPRDADD